MTLKNGFHWVSDTVTLHARSPQNKSVFWCKLKPLQKGRKEHVFDIAFPASKQTEDINFYEVGSGDDRSSVIAAVCSPVELVAALIELVNVCLSSP